ncbi:MAG: hypothetical protein P4L84_16660 [Isosphaeraceae bacterium]|nr:hypothetical protein [Isosphaeraceae bacterium]
MEFLSEDPTYLAGGLGLLGLVFLLALRVTQQGKFLVWALTAWALAVAALGIERLWVTDNERIEQVVYDLGRELAGSDTEGLLKHLTPDVQFRAGDRARENSRFVLRNLNLAMGAATRAYIKNELEQCEFDFVRISQLQAHAGRQSRRGTADFRVMTGGRYRGQPASGPTDWSLGFVETSPNVWQVDRITPTALPNDIVLQATGAPGGSAFSKGVGAMRPPYPMPERSR